MSLIELFIQIIKSMTNLWESIKQEFNQSKFVSRTVVYAIGGNALSSPNGESKEESAMVLAKVISDVIDLLEAGWKVILTHGNGPQVGYLMALDSSLPMDEWVAATQGMIGHSLAINLDSILRRRNRPESTAVVLTRVEVDENDTGFKFPTKPVGPVLTDKQVMSEDWDIAETKIGARRVVASPQPQKILDLDVIKSLVNENAIVICCGGGGIPVINKGGHYLGVPAVIDKDRLSTLLAVEMNVDALIISTAVDAIRTDFGGPNEKIHHEMSASDAIMHLNAGEFPNGSMGPKVESLIEAVQKVDGIKSVLCQPGNAIKALRGESGTTLVA